ncbi:glutamyl-tRNA reductase [Melioribacteraceae bacterium 4301-Me]|uniref:glutamyl-tRNA reductase n=1 Tax=Pyranulibacter aquaticus TaxID=3163344 RepID=UPI003597D379
MNLFGITINHRTASIELREALYLSKNEIIDFIHLLKKELFSEGFVLSTCNRTEVFGFPQKNLLDYNLLIKHLLNFKKIDGLTSDNFEKFFSCGAVRHIFSVSTGIDSMIIGDSQILAQVKEAFEISEDLNFAGTIMRRVFDFAIKTGKRAIKETSIGEGAVTVSYAAVQVIEKIFSNLDKKSALVIGAGETGEIAAVHLKDKGVGKLAISNRTLSKAEALAEKVHGEIVPFQYLKEHLHNFDIILSATSAENLILNFDDIQSMMKKRKNSPVVLMDIAVPRDIDPNVKKIENVFYHDMDSLKIIVDQNIQKRKNEIPLVNKIIMEELVNFFSWYNTLEIVPAIKSLREFFEEIRNDELNKIRHKISKEDYAKLEDMTRRMIGRLLHNPTVKLRELAEQGMNTQEIINHSVVLKELFNLDKFEPNGFKNNNEKKE